MNIRQERNIEVVANTKEFQDRLKSWAELTGFTCITELPGRWKFCRGSNWNLSIGFDIRKTPTEVIVERNEDNPTKVYCLMHCKSWCYLATPGDLKRLSEQLDILVAHLKGALGN